MPKIQYLTISISDENLYIALIKKVAEKKGKGLKKTTIKKLAEKYLWDGILKDK